MHDHKRRAGRARALECVSRVRPPVRRRSAISEPTDTSESTSNGASNGESPGVAGGVAKLPDAHVRVGVIEQAPPAALTDEQLTEGLPERQAALLVDLFAVIEEHADDAIEPVDRERVSEAFRFSCERHADQQRKSGEEFIT